MKHCRVCFVSLPLQTGSIISTLLDTTDERCSPNVTYSSDRLYQREYCTR
jgi:hypothetical protein